MDGLAKDGSSIPSDTLKAQLLDLLESDKTSLDGLAKVLRIDTTRFGMVRELVINYEERFGPLSLDKWKYILRRLGYLEYFQLHVAADQIMGDATDIDDLDDEPSLAAKQWPRNYCGARFTSTNTPVGRLPVGNQQQGQSKFFEHESREFGPKNDTEVNLSAMTAGTVRNTPWPTWSLPPPEENMKKENAVEDVANGDNDHDSTGKDVAIESGFFSNEDTSLENNRISSNVQSLVKTDSSALSFVPETENETSQFENVAAPEEEARGHIYTASASLHTNSVVNQQSDEIHVTPSRPTTPEAPCSSRNPLVTGHHRSGQDNTVAGDNPSQNDQESGSPVEHYDDTENNGLLTELQKANESLQLSVCYQVEELRKKDLLCAHLRTQCYQLQQQLEESRGQCAQRQVTIQELRRHVNESTVLEAESQQLIRMTQEENRRLQLLVRQLRCKEVGSVRSGDSCEDVPCSTASSEVEGGEQPRSSNCSQQSDSDDSSDDERFEDARDEFDFS